MKEKHPIDSFFKEKLADRQYPMKGEYWSAAADLIEAQGGRKRRRFLWLFLLIGLLITGSTIGYYFSLDSVENLNTPTEILSALEADPEGKLPEKALIAGEDKLSGGGETKEEPAPIASASPVSHAASSEANSLLAKNSRDRSGNGKNPIATEATHSEHNKRILDALGREQAELDANTADRGIPLVQKREEQGREYQARVLDERAFELEEQNPSNPSFRYQGRTSPFKHQWGLDLGFAVNKGIKDPASSGQSLGMSPVIGITYRRRFNAQLMFISGLRYTQMPALAGDSTFLSTDFSFGAQVEGINIKALSLHQAEIPLQLAWNTGARSKLVGGAYFRYLINVQSEVSRFESNPFESTPGPVNRAWGYKQGFSDLDYGLQLGYFYHLSEGLEIGLETQFGLKDVRNNAFYRITSFDRNLNARILLRYHFLN